ncbi:MAG TPA: universal stress protein [Puia sp.]|nr:universal stress protein [Puia sp.]
MKSKTTILVPTDLSPASRAGMRFAIQWTRQQDARLVFVHVLRLLRMSSWSDKQYEAFAATERAMYSRRLERIAAEVCRYMQIGKKTYTTEVVEGMSADIALLEFSRQRGEIDLICMTTGGAGKFKKLLGTHTGNLILRSEIPVIAVPAGYRAKRITRILYATDLAGYDDELARILKLTRPLRAEVIVVHFPQPGEPILDPTFVNKVWEKEYGYPLQLRYQTGDPALSLAENLQEAIGKLKPSLVVMFTDQQRTHFQRVFYPSQAERLSFQVKVPLLVMGKNNTGALKRETVRTKIPWHRS